MRHKVLMDHLAAIQENKRRQQQRYEEGMAKGITKGTAEGEYKKGVAIAVEMLNDGLSVEKVVKYSGLSFEEVNRLKGN